MKRRLQESRILNIFYPKMLSYHLHAVQHDSTSEPWGSLSPMPHAEIIAYVVIKNRLNPVGEAASVRRVPSHAGL